MEGRGGGGSTEACQKEQGMSLKRFLLAKYRTILSSKYISTEMDYNPLNKSRIMSPF